MSATSTASEAKPGSSSSSVFIKLRVPEGLEDMLEGLAREVIRLQPENITHFSAHYCERLLAIRQAEGYDSSVPVSEVVAKGRFDSLQEKYYKTLYGRLSHRMKEKEERVKSPTTREEVVNSVLGSMPTKDDPPDKISPNNNNNNAEKPTSLDLNKKHDSMYIEVVFKQNDQKKSNSENVQDSLSGKDDIALLDEGLGESVLAVDCSDANNQEEVVEDQIIPGKVGYVAATPDKLVDEVVTTVNNEQGDIEVASDEIVAEDTTVSSEEIIQDQEESANIAESEEDPVATAETKISTETVENKEICESDEQAADIGEAADIDESEQVAEIAHTEKSPVEAPETEAQATEISDATDKAADIVETEEQPEDQEQALTADNTEKQTIIEADDAVEEKDSVIESEVKEVTDIVEGDKTNEEIIRRKRSIVIEQEFSQPPVSDDKVEDDEHAAANANDVLDDPVNTSEANEDVELEDHQTCTDGTETTKADDTAATVDNEDENLEEATADVVVETASIEQNEPSEEQSDNAPNEGTAEQDSKTDETDVGENVTIQQTETVSDENSVATDAENVCNDEIARIQDGIEKTDNTMNENSDSLPDISTNIQNLSAASEEISMQPNEVNELKNVEDVVESAAEDDKQPSSGVHAESDTKNETNEAEKNKENEDEKNKENEDETKTEKESTAKSEEAEENKRSEDVSESVINEDNESDEHLDKETKGDKTEEANAIELEDTKKSSESLDIQTDSLNEKEVSVAESEDKTVIEDGEVCTDDPLATDEPDVKLKHVTELEKAVHADDGNVIEELKSNIDLKGKELETEPSADVNPETGSPQENKNVFEFCKMKKEDVVDTVQAEEPDQKEFEHDETKNLDNPSKDLELEQTEQAIENNTETDEYVKEKDAQVEITNKVNENEEIKSSTTEVTSKSSKNDDNLATENGKVNDTTENQESAHIGDKVADSKPDVEKFVDQVSGNAIAIAEHVQSECPLEGGTESIDGSKDDTKSDNSTEPPPKDIKTFDAVVDGETTGEESEDHVLQRLPLTTKENEEDDEEDDRSDIIKEIPNKI